MKRKRKNHFFFRRSQEPAFQRLLFPRVNVPDKHKKRRLHVDTTQKFALDPPTFFFFSNNTCREEKRVVVK